MKKFFIASSFALVCLCAMAQTDPMSTAISTILASNADIAAQEALIKAQQADNTDANSLANPEVSFSRVWGAHGIGNKLQLDIQQSFDWPGLYRLRSRAAAQGVSAQEMTLVGSKLDLALQAKELMLELVYVRKQIALQQSMISNVEQLGKALEKSLDKGEVTALDYRKQQLEAYKLQAALAALQDRQMQIAAQLSGMAPGASLSLDGIDAYPIEPVLAREDYMQQVAEVDPLLASYRMAAEQERLNAKAALQSRMPSFSVGYEHQAEMGDRFNGFTVGMSLPFFQNRKAKAAAISRREASESSARMLVGQRQAEVEGLLQQLQLWRSQIDAYNRVFGDNAYLKLLNIAYEGGKLNTIEYLSEIQYYSETTLSKLEAEYNYHTALASLNRYALLDL